MQSDRDRQLLDTLPGPLILVRQDGSIEFANRQAQKLFGYSADELSGLQLEMLLPERYRDRHKELRLGYFTTPAVRPMGRGLDLFAKCKDGREIAVEVSLSPLEIGDVMVVAASIRDVSDRKAAELQLRHALEEIETLKDQLLAENQYLREEIISDHDFHEIVGQSDALKLTLAQVERVAPTDASVLITGETGVGKELIARAIHDRSRRSDHPMVKLNCAALPASLVESELFGHEKGAFTGAVEQRIGRFELAHGGTIFLDEIGELDLPLQAKLLRVLQGGELERIGSGTTRTVDVRVIAASNRDLQKAIRDERFRSDLYFRLAVFSIDVPPLRERRDDVPLLVWHIIAKHKSKLGKTIDDIPQSVMQMLSERDWPGNVRELENVIQRAMILSPDHGPLVLSHIRVDQPSPPHAQLKRMSDVERHHIHSTLEQCQWRIKGTNNAADQLGLEPSTLRHRMKKLGIERPPNR